MPYHEVFDFYSISRKKAASPSLKKKLGNGCFPRNTEAVRTTLRFHILAFFHTNSDAICLPREREMLSW